MIKQGDSVRLLPQWQDKGDDKYQWIAAQDSDGPRVRITPIGTGLLYPPVYTVELSMLEKTK